MNIFGICRPGERKTLDAASVRAVLRGLSDETLILLSQEDDHVIEQRIASMLEAGTVEGERGAAIYERPQ